MEESAVMGAPETLDVEPLFADEAVVTEAELTGEQATAAPAEAAKPPAREPEPSADLQREIDRLKAENFALQHKPISAGEDSWKGFRLLSDSEFEDLRDDDPDEAIIYLRKENQYKEHIQKQQVEHASTRAFEEQILDDAWAQISTVIPDVTDHDRPEVQQKVAELNRFAVENGLTDQHLKILTNPATRVLVKGPDGRERAVLLGDTAAAVVRIIDKFHKTAKGSPSKRFPRSTTHDSHTEGAYTEENWAKLPESKRRALLGG